MRQLMDTTFVRMPLKSIDGHEGVRSNCMLRIHVDDPRAMSPFQLHVAHTCGWPAGDEHIEDPTGVRSIAESMQILNTDTSFQELTDVEARAVCYRETDTRVS